MHRPNVLPGAVAASVVLHGAFIAAGAALLLRFATRDVETVAPAQRIVDVSVEAPTLELPVVSGRSVEGSVLPAERTEPEPSGGAAVPRPDTGEPGRGGDRFASEQALSLSHSVDGLTLNPDPANFDRSDQVQRLEVSRERRSREDRRATPNPMEWTFLATGSGIRHERRPLAPTDAAAGVLRGGALGSAGEATETGGAAPMPRAVQAAGDDRPQGIDRGRVSTDYRRSASVALARPAVRLGRASVPATGRGRPSDTVDSAQKVASAVQALVTASASGGLHGHGLGGSDDGERPASGGLRGGGFSTSAQGDHGSGDDPRVTGINNYAESVARKVYPYWEDAFPYWARVEGRGGLAIVSITILADGTPSDVRIVRESGIDEFDRNVAEALRRAAPYGPLPVALRQSGVRLHIAFDATNPIVGRSGPGPGRRR